MKSKYFCLKSGVLNPVPNELFIWMFFVRGKPKANLLEITGGYSVPQIIINDKCIGGYDKLLYLHQNNKLNKLLNEK